MEPALLLPMGFGAILVNLPLSGAVTQIIDGVEEIGVLNVLFDAGIANELFPLLLFVGIGAMIDFEPLLNDPKLMFFGAAAQFGIFFTFSLAALLGFPIKDAAAIGIIGAADGPTAIFMANFLKSNYLGAIMVAAYSYMALVPLVQPPVIRALTTKHERLIRMPYHQHTVTKRTKIFIPDHYHRRLRHRLAAKRGAGRLFDVRQPHRGVRRAGFSFRDGAEDAFKSHYALPGPHHRRAHAGRVFPSTKQTLLDIMALGLAAFIFRHSGRCAGCEADQSVPAEGEKTQSDDRRLRHFSVSDVPRASSTKWQLRKTRRIICSCSAWVSTYPGRSHPSSRAVCC